MFNKIIIDSRPVRPQHNTVTVTEKRAPTDDSIQMLREMKQKARDEVLASIKIGDTAFECVVHLMCDQMSNDTIFRAVVSLNGKNIKVESRSRSTDTIESRVTKLVDNLSHRIATEILRPSLDQLESWMRAR